MSFAGSKSILRTIRILFWTSTMNQIFVYEQDCYFTWVFVVTMEPKLQYDIGLRNRTNCIVFTWIAVKKNPKLQFYMLNVQPKWRLTFYIVVSVITVRTRYKISLRWRHNGRDSVSNHQPHDCLLNRLFGRRSQKTWKLCVTGLCAGNSPGKMFPFDDIIMFQ